MCCLSKYEDWHKTDNASSWLIFSNSKLAFNEALLSSELWWAQSIIFHDSWLYKVYNPKKGCEPHYSVQKLAGNGQKVFVCKSLVPFHLKYLNKFFLFSQPNAVNKLIVKTQMHLCWYLSSFWSFCVRLICMQIYESVTAFCKFTDRNTSTLLNKLGYSLELSWWYVNEFSTIICHTWKRSFNKRIQWNLY